MKWKNDWPIIGTEGKDGIGVPVSTYKKPNAGKNDLKISPPDSDEFNDPKLGLQWQWQANSQIQWGFPSALGYYTLNCIPKPQDYHNLLDVPHILLQKLPAPNFTATTKIEFTFNFDQEEAGLVMAGLEYCYLRIKRTDGKVRLSQIIGLNSDKKQADEEKESVPIKGNTLFLRVKVTENQESVYSYSEDNIHFKNIGVPFQIKKGKWIGARLGFVALRQGFINDAGYIKMDWIRFTGK